MFDSALRAIYSTLAPAGVNARLSTLIYHRVLSEPVPMLPYEPSAAQFERRMRWAQRHFNVIPLSDAVARLQSGTLPMRPLAITFDDGYADNERIAAPILSKLGMPATFFIATDYLDGGRMFNDSIVAAMGECKRSSLDLSELGLENYSLQSIDAQAARRLVDIAAGKGPGPCGAWSEGGTHLPTRRSRSTRRFNDDLIAGRCARSTRLCYRGTYGKPSHPCSVRPKCGTR